MQIISSHLDFLRAHSTHIPVIIGSTASGKSALGVHIAHELNGEIIVADSRQCYLGMNIGSGKTTTKEMEGIPHHIQDSMGPGDTMTVGTFLERATIYIEEIKQRGKRPIVLGGTGLYVQALVEGYAPSREVTENVRAHVESLYEQQGMTYVLSEIHRLKKPEDILPHDLQNPRRATRTLELLFSGHALQQEKAKLPYDWYVIGIHWPKEQLRSRIALRHAQMFEEDGLLKEYQSLLIQGYSATCEAMTSIGYDEVREYFSGKYSKDEAKELTILHAKQYAKRQESWWKRMEKTVPIHWVNGAEMT